MEYEATTGWTGITATLNSKIFVPIVVRKGVKMMKVLHCKLLGVFNFSFSGFASVYFLINFKMLRHLRTIGGEKCVAL